MKENDVKTKLLLKNYHRRLVGIYDDMVEKIPEGCIVETRDMFGFKRSDIPLLTSLGDFIGDLEDDISEFDNKG